LFSALHLIPAHGQVVVMQETIRWNYTSALDLLFLAASAALLVRFLKTGGPAMLREMGNVPADPNAEAHSCCHEEPAAMVTMHDCCHQEPEPVLDCCRSEPVAAAAHDCCHAEPAAIKGAAPESSHRDH
jgi:hypothetical protein